MKNLTILIAVLLICSCKQERVQYAIVIHGGAGTILQENMTREQEAEYLAKLNEALDVGSSLLLSGAEALEVVVETIKILEDSPLFNAGKGAVYSNAGLNEMDASIMNGADQEAGAVAGITTIKNPISAAYKVLRESEHVLLCGAGAEKFAKLHGCESADKEYFRTERRWEALQRIRDKESMGNNTDEPADSKFGTVGCVVLDKQGNIAAGTSTGGMTNKKYNRIGDSPIIGAGTYADNATCGISSTGHGEYFIRYAVAHDIAARMEYKKISLEKAAEELINGKLILKGGSGGIVGLDRLGNISMVFNTAGMYRGYDRDGIRVVKIYK